MNRNHHARAMLVISMAVFGTLGPFVRCIPLSSGALALAATLIFLYLVITRQKIPLQKIQREIPLLLLSGSAMGINWILLFESYKYTTVSIATLSYYFAPVIVTAACPFLFRERLTGKQILCFLMSTIGLILITGLGKETGGGQDLIGILFGLGAAAFYAAVILLNKLIRQVEGIHRTLLQFLAAILVLIPYVTASGGMGLNQITLGGFAALLTVGFVHTGITYCLYFSSLKELPGQKAAILSYIDPLVAILVSIVFLGEKISSLQILGGAMILGFTLLNELPSGQKEAADSHAGA